MATFNFSTITDAQALAIGLGDSLVFDLAAASATTLLFAANGQFTIDQGGRSVVFGAGFTLAARSFTDGSRLFVGSSGDDLSRNADVREVTALYGSLGGDTLEGGLGADLLQGNQGADNLNGGAGSDIIYGGQDDDRIDTGGGGDFAQGNRGNDILLGSGDGADSLLGGQGNDLINADAFLFGGINGYLSLSPLNLRDGSGGDLINGNLGNDTLFASGGDDLIFGEGGNDYLHDARGGRNVLDGGDGNDTVNATASSGSNTLRGGGGNDVILTGLSAVVDGGDGDDTVGLLSTGSTYVVALGGGNDACSIVDVPRFTDFCTIDGGEGNDLIIAGNADGDSVTGGAGDDTLDGGAGSDVLVGGAGSDQFRYSLEADGGEIDVILDWSIEDRFYFEYSLSHFPVGAGSAGNYLESTAADYATARAFANLAVSNTEINYVAVQVGADVYVFADSLGFTFKADSVIRLVGRTLDDISFGCFDGVSRLTLP